MCRCDTFIRDENDVHDACDVRDVHWIMNMMSTKLTVFLKGQSTPAPFLVGFHPSSQGKLWYHWEIKKFSLKCCFCLHKSLSIRNFFMGEDCYDTMYVADSIISDLVLSQEKVNSNRWSLRGIGFWFENLIKFINLHSEQGPSRDLEDVLMKNNRQKSCDTVSLINHCVGQTKKSQGKIVTFTSPWKQMKRILNSGLRKDVHVRKEKEF